MVKIAVCDDEYIFSELIAEKIETEMQKYDMLYKIDKYTSGLELLAQHEINPYDIIFLDIEMPGIDGFEAITQLRSIKSDILVIYITNHSGLVYPSYQYRPFELIAKRDFTSKIGEIIKSAINELRNIRELNSYYAVERYGHSQLIYKSHIIYAKAIHHGVKLYTLDGVFNVRKTLRQLSNELNSDYLILCHRSYLINMQQVLEAHEDNLILSNGIKLPISRRYRRNVLKKYN